jgi:hypothetical protein
VPEQVQLAKAELRQLDANYQNEINREKWAKVQFNPETLKVSFANQLQTPSGAGDQRGTPARQFVGAGTTKLAVTLYFDVTSPLPGPEADIDDVRKLTQKVAYYITPEKTDDNPPQYLPAAVRFLWGSFQFDGLMDSMEETLEFFSNDGKPLRANVSIALSQQKITEFVFRPTDTPPTAPRTPGGRPPGRQPHDGSAGGRVAAGARRRGRRRLARRGGGERHREPAHSATRAVDRSQPRNFRRDSLWQS